MTRWPVAVDAVAVLAFVLIGRASHGEADGPLGVLTTLWPFLAGLTVGWVVLVRRHLDGVKVQAGVVTGLYAAVVGLALRAVAGQGVALSFGVVAVVVLTLFMVGWRVGRRVLARILRR